MLFTLRPLALESQGLVSALEQLAGKMQETYNQAMRIEAAPGVAVGVFKKKVSSQAVVNIRMPAR